MIVLLAALALAILPAGTATSGAVMFLAAVTGVLGQFTYLAVETAGSQVSQTAADRAHRVQSVMIGIDQGTTLAGPALGGVLLQWTGATGMLTVLGVLSLAGVVLAPTQQQPAPATPVSVLHGLRTGWRTLRSLPALAWLIAGLSAANLASGLLQAAAPIIVVTILGHSSASVGIIWSAAAAASLAAVAVARLAIDRYGMWPVAVTGATLGVAACLALAHATTYPAWLALAGLFMASEGAITVILRTLRSRLIPKDAAGSTLALTILLLLAPFPLAGLLVALTPPPDLGAAITASALVQATGFAIALAHLRTHPLTRPAPGLPSAR